MKSGIERIAMLSAILLMACGSDELSTSESSTSVPVVSISVIDSIGIEMGDSNYVFGSIAGIGLAPDGNIVVLDNAKSIISVYSSDGMYLRRIAGKGCGPGELQSAAFLGISEAGIIYVVGEGSGLLGCHSFDYYSGEWIESIQTGNPPTCLEGGEGTSHVRVDNEYQNNNGQPCFIFSVARWEEESDEPACVFHEYAVDFDPQNMGRMITRFWDAYEIAVGNEGEIYLAPYNTNKAEIYAFRRNGEALFNVDLNYEPVCRSNDELEIEQNVLVMRAAIMDIPAVGLEAELYKPLIRGLEVDSIGNIWVHRGDSNSPRFDVLSPAGELLYKAALDYDPADGSTWQFCIGDAGMLAYAEDPCLGFQKVYILKTDCESIQTIDSQ